MSDIDKAIILVIIANIIQFVVAYFANHNSRNNVQVEQSVTRIAVIEKDLALLRQEVQDLNKRK